MILLDTDILVDLLRKFPQALAWLESLGDEELVMPGYVAMELIQGCRSRAELDSVEEQIRRMMIAWPTSEVCDRALAVYVQARFSHGVGLLDALVGQLAVSLDAPLHTFNQKHYSGIPSLKTIQPYRR